MDAFNLPPQVYDTELTQALAGICPNDPALGLTAFIHIASHALVGLCHLGECSPDERELVRDAFGRLDGFDIHLDRALTLRAIAAVSVYLGLVETLPPHTNLLGMGHDRDEERALAAIQALAHALVRGERWPAMRVLGSSWW